MRSPTLCTTWFHSVHCAALWLRTTWLCQDPWFHQLQATCIRFLQNTYYLYIYIYMCVCVFLFLQAFTPLPFQEKTMDYMVIQLGPQTLDVSTRLRSDRDSWSTGQFSMRTHDPMCMKRKWISNELNSNWFKRFVFLREVRCDRWERRDHKLHHKLPGKLWTPKSSRNFRKCWSSVELRTLLRTLFNVRNLAKLKRSKQSQENPRVKFSQGDML